MFEQRQQRHRLETVERDAIVQGTRRLTFDQLVRRADQLAGVLGRAGLGSHRERADLEGWESGQDHLALYLHNGNEYLEGMIGAYKARLAPFNVNYRYVAEELRYLLGDAKASAIVYHSCFAPTLAEVLPELPDVTIYLDAPPHTVRGLAARLSDVASYDEAGGRAIEAARIAAAVARHRDRAAIDEVHQRRIAQHCRVGVTIGVIRFEVVDARRDAGVRGLDPERLSQRGESPLGRDRQILADGAIIVIDERAAVARQPGDVGQAKSDTPWV